MFENEIKFITDFTLNKIKDSGSFITLEKFLSKDIHPAIKKFVEAEINYLFYADRKRIIENSLFDYTGQEISHYLDLIGVEIKRTKKIAFEDIKNIVFQAVSFNANFVVHPEWTLTKLIFGNNKTISVDEFKMMLNYCFYYDYLTSILMSYIGKKKLSQLSINEFQIIVNKINTELFNLHQSKLVDNALGVIGDYFNIGVVRKTTIAIESVEIFLQEKNLSELLFKIKSNYSKSAKKVVTIDEIKKVLNSAISFSDFIEEKMDEKIKSEESVSEVISQTDLNPANKNELDNEYIEIEAIDDGREELNILESDKDDMIIIKDNELIIEDILKDKDVVNQDIFLEENGSANNNKDNVLSSDDNSIDESGKTENGFTEIKNSSVTQIEDKGFELPQNIESESTQIDESSVNLDQDLVEVNTVVDDQTDIKISSEAIEAKPEIVKRKKDLLDFLSDKEVNRVIDNVFNSDSEDFVSSIEELNSKTDYQDAVMFLENIFNYKQVKLKSKEATALKKALENYFNQDN